MNNSEKLLLCAIKYLGIKESLTGWDETVKKWIYASCDSIGLEKPDDDSKFAWCACFVSNMLHESGIWTNEKHIVSARKFLDVGNNISNPEMGDIVILERGKGFGHIGFYINETESKVKLLSGNSYDSVSISDYDKKRILGIRKI